MERQPAATPSPRLNDSPASLIRAAVGGPRAIAGKCRRAYHTLGTWLTPSEVDQRLAALRDRGLIRSAPTRWQLLFGGIDMLRFVIEPAARDYYAQKGISFGFHQLLRVLDDPVSMIDPTGFLSERDTIIGHVMQVVHLNPVYDLQLLQMFPDGLDALEAQVQAMVDGTHARAGSIGAIIEDPGYHARLLEYVRGYRSNPEAAPPVREEQTLRSDPVFAAAERTFASLPGFIEYCHKLPPGFVSLLRRLATMREFPTALAA